MATVVDGTLERWTRERSIAELRAYADGHARAGNVLAAVGADLAVSWLLDPTRAELRPLAGYPSPYGLATFPTRASHGTLLTTATAYVRAYANPEGS